MNQHRRHDNCLKYDSFFGFKNFNRDYYKWAKSLKMQIGGSILIIYSKSNIERLMKKGFDQYLPF